MTPIPRSPGFSLNPSPRPPGSDPLDGLGRKPGWYRAGKLNGELNPSWKPDFRTGFRNREAEQDDHPDPPRARPATTSVAIPIPGSRAGFALRQTELPVVGLAVVAPRLFGADALRREGLSQGRLRGDRAALGRSRTGLSWAVRGDCGRRHCCYANSSPADVFPPPGPGCWWGQRAENAGVLDLARASGLPFKNRGAITIPRRWKPFQGAATGVGASCATSSPWAPDRLPCSIALRFAPSTTPATLA